MTTLLAAINAQTATTGITASQDAVTGTLKLTGTAGKDIVLDDSGITAGAIGWKTADKTSTDLYGFKMTMSINGTATYAGNISAVAGTMKNWANSGLDLTTSGAVVSRGTGIQPRRIQRGHQIRHGQPGYHVELFFVRHRLRLPRPVPCGQRLFQKVL